ncbi:unnamed protein product [Penicillium manginii]
MFPSQRNHKTSIEGGRSDLSTGIQLSGSRVDIDAPIPVTPIEDVHQISVDNTSTDDFISPENNTCDVARQQDCQTTNPQLPMSQVEMAVAMQQFPDNRYHKLEKELDIMTKKCDALQAELTTLRNVLPDPPMFSDGIEPIIQIEDKLRRSAEQLSTPELQIAYVFSRCKGPAARLMAYRMQPSNILPYKDVDDIMIHLVTSFEHARCYPLQDSRRKMQSMVHECDIYDN